jgi:hypothetical protein
MRKAMWIAYLLVVAFSVLAVSVESNENNLIGAGVFVAVAGGVVVLADRTIVGRREKRRIAELERTPEGQEQLRRERQELAARVAALHRTSVTREWATPPPPFEHHWIYSVTCPTCGSIDWGSDERAAQAAARGHTGRA